MMADNEGSLYLLDLNDVLPLLDALEYAIQDWLERRKQKQADIVLVNAAAYALVGWSTSVMQNLHHVKNETAVAMVPSIHQMALDIMLLMHTRRIGAKSNVNRN
jgi:hypothetical protein